jgi:hypothetical protein
MANIYTWVIKNLNSDMRGYATIGFFEMQGKDGNGITANSAVTVCFGADELKPLAQWTPADIDAYAQTKQEGIEQDIAIQISALNARITALEV